MVIKIITKIFIMLIFSAKSHSVVTAAILNGSKGP